MRKVFVALAMLCVFSSVAFARYYPWHAPNPNFPYLLARKQCNPVLARVQFRNNSDKNIEFRWQLITAGEGKVRTTKLIAGNESPRLKSDVGCPITINILDVTTE